MGVVVIMQVCVQPLTIPDILIVVFIVELIEIVGELWVFHLTD